jgi:hypothetical protein
LKGLEVSDGDPVAEEVEWALGPVGILLGPVGGTVGEEDGPVPEIE